MKKVSASTQNKCSSSLTCFFVFGLAKLTLIVQNYLANFSSQIGNFVWIQNLLSLLFSGVMIWLLVKTGHGYLFRIPRKKWFGIRF